MGQTIDQIEPPKSHRPAGWGKEKRVHLGHAMERNADLIARAHAITAGIDPDQEEPSKEK